jgi:hypothetical protein
LRNSTSEGSPTKPKLDLKALVGKSAEADFLNEMIGFAAHPLMELDVGGLTGAGYGAKDAEQLVQRNGLCTYADGW